MASRGRESFSFINESPFNISAAKYLGFTISFPLEYVSAYDYQNNWDDLNVAIRHINTQ